MKIGILVGLILFCNQLIFAQIGEYTKAKIEIEELIFTNKIRVDERLGTTTFNYLYPIEKVEVHNDSILIIAKCTKYKVNLKGEAKIISDEKNLPSKTFKVSIFFNYEEYYPRSVVLNNLSFNIPDMTKEEDPHLKRFANALLVLRENYGKEQNKKEKSKELDSLLNHFQQVILPSKQSRLSENDLEKQRDLMVQANVFFEEKKYFEVINLYEKAVEINPVSYPPLYFNLALIYELIENYQYAIFNMKKYVLLEPQAEDTDEAKDKITEWSINLNN